MTRNKIIGYAVGPLGSAALGFATLPIITWFYPAEDVGRISMLQVATSCFILVFCLGLDQAYMRGYYESSNRARLARSVIFPSMLLAICFSIFLCVLDLGRLSRWLYAKESNYLSAISVACFVLALISRFLSLILRVQERALAFSMSQLLPKFLFLILILSAVWAGLLADFHTLLTIHLFAFFTAFIVLVWSTRREWLASFGERINRKELTPLLTFGLPLVFGGLAMWGLIAMDKVFLRGLSSLSELAIYSVSVSVAGVATVFAGVFNTIWAPMVYKWVGEGEVDVDKIDEITEYVLAAVCLAIILAGMSSWVLPLFLPNEYSRIEYLLMACLVGPLFYTLSEATGVGVAISRKTVYAMWAAVGAVLVNAVGNYMLIPLYGAAGAAIATALSFWILFVLRTELSVRFWRRTPRVRSYLATLTICGVSMISALPSLDGQSLVFFMWSALLVLWFFLFWRVVVAVFYKLLGCFY